MTPARGLSDLLVLFDWNGTIVADADRARVATNGVLARRELPTLDAERFPYAFRLPLGVMFGELGVVDDDAGSKGLSGC
jgi:phosphoglycolate phosphatase